MSKSTFAQVKDAATSITEILLMQNGATDYGAAARLAVDSRVLTDALEKIGQLHATIPALTQRIDATEKKVEAQGNWQTNWEKRFTGRMWVAFTVGYAAGMWSLFDLIVRVMPFVAKIIK
jgi:hypothetical protein